MPERVPVEQRRFLTLAETAAKLERRPETVYRWAAKGGPEWDALCAELGGRRLYGCWQFSKAHVEAYVARQEPAQEAAPVVGARLRVVGR